MHSHEEFLPVQLFQLQITPDGTLTPVCRIGPALALPQRQVSSAIKCNIGWKLEAPSSSSLDTTKASLFPIWATGMNRSGRGNSDWTDSCQGWLHHLLARSVSLSTLAFLATWLDTFPEQGDRGKKKKKKKVLYIGFSHWRRMWVCN